MSTAHILFMFLHILHELTAPADNEMEKKRKKKSKIFKNFERWR